MAVDGEENTVVEVDVVSEPMGAANPAGNAYQLRETVLASESVARRVIEPYASRTWTVINPGSTNHMGKPVGYKLVPTGVTWPQADPESGKKPVFFSHLYINVNMIIFPNRLGTNTGKPQKRDRHVAQ
jgi:Cu2+-containing amine oxidase